MNAIIIKVMPWESYWGQQIMTPQQNTNNNKKRCHPVIFISPV